MPSSYTGEGKLTITVEEGVYVGSRKKCRNDYCFSSLFLLVTSIIKEKKNIYCKRTLFRIGGAFLWH
jgi:hypothetical protein